MPNIPATKERRGFMFVLSSPSGAGKTTLSRLLLEREKNLVMSVSVTTRPKRPGEIEGNDYFFVSKDDFGRMVEEEQFLEYAVVFGEFYGTPRKKVQESLQQGIDVLFDIDWQGTQQITQRARQDVVSVFILPPSMSELERRLYHRAQDSAETVAKRMAKAHNEISHWHEYDYVIINSSLDESLERIAAILQAERLKRTRQHGLKQFVEQLLKE